MTALPVKVVHVIDSLGVGGAEQALHLLVRHLDPDRFHCRVFPLGGLGPLASDLDRQGLLATTVVARSLPGQLRALHRYLARERPSIVHTHLNRSDLLAGPIARAGGVPVVLSYKASILRIHGRRQRLHDWLTRVAARSNDVVVVLSGALRRYLLSRRIVPDEKIRVVRYGVELDGDGGPPARRDDLGLGDGPVVLLAARLEPRKDHRTFLEAARLVLTQKPDVQFLLAGDGAPWYRAQLERQAAPLGRAIRFLGNCQEVPALMRLSTVVVLSSQTEGLGLVLLEAMVERRPVVATRVGGVPEVVVDGETGLLVEPGSPTALARAMLDVLDQPERARQMGEAGRRCAEAQFSVERMARDMAALYEELLARRAPAAALV